MHQRCWDLRTGWSRLARLREHRLGWTPTRLAPPSSTWRSWHPRRRRRAPRPRRRGGSRRAREHGPWRRVLVSRLMRL
ncbi:hypothetical protein GQ55_7G323900 [Panicum hallii var. hallii]|uniref:Uncharacterized protein n=1 Tax=Panicum hallii var. hallii TaxID=1504633 RepID=A0A2T7D1I9_9POAL|nr:hypothetical protein GQ55_7G323900 [Panicum hallii var. hallii]